MDTRPRCTQLSSRAPSSLPWLAVARLDTQRSTGAVTMSGTSLVRFCLTRRKLSPCVSRPARPALPTIYLYWALESWSRPMKGDLMTTLLAGRLTPAARVLVQQSTPNTSEAKASSNNFLSSMVSPEW